MLWEKGFTSASSALKVKPDGGKRGVRKIENIDAVRLAARQSHRRTGTRNSAGLAIGERRGRIVVQYDFKFHSLDTF